MPDIRSPKEKAELDLLEFQRLVADADVVFVGKDPSYESYSMKHRKE